MVLPTTSTEKLMPKKKKNEKAKVRKDAAERLARDVGESAHKIWLAGLGMFDSAREGGGKLFDKMVKRGEKVETRAKPMATQAAQDVRAAVRKEMRRLETQMKTLLNKVEAWRSTPTPAADPAPAPRRPATARKKAVRKPAGAKKKATARKKAVRKPAAARKKAKARKAVRKPAAPKKKAVRKRAAPVKKTARKRAAKKKTRG